MHILHIKVILCSEMLFMILFNKYKVNCSLKYSVRIVLISNFKLVFFQENIWKQKIDMNIWINKDVVELYSIKILEYLMHILFNVDIILILTIIPFSKKKIKIVNIWLNIKSLKMDKKFMKIMKSYWRNK